MSFNHYYQSEIIAVRQLTTRFAECSPVLTPFIGGVWRRYICGNNAMQLHRATRFAALSLTLTATIFLLAIFFFAKPTYSIYAELFQSEQEYQGETLALMYSRYIFTVIAPCSFLLASALTWLLMARGWVAFISATLILIVVLLAVAFLRLEPADLHREAQVSIPSPSNRFILQSVPLASWSDLAYLRVTDTQAPQGVFRTPLYSKQYTDMRPHEDEKTVGTYWIDFDKQEQTFEIGIPEWRDSWLNIFISNTPYRISEN